MTAPETEGQSPRTCWRGECRTVCYYPDVCSGVAPASVTGVALTAEEREALIQVLSRWTFRRAAEPTRHDTLGDVVDVVLAAGFRRGPDTLREELAATEARVQFLLAANIALTKQNVELTAARPAPASADVPTMPRADCRCPDDCDCDGRFACEAQPEGTKGQWVCELAVGHTGAHKAGNHRWSAPASAATTTETVEWGVLYDAVRPRMTEPHLHPEEVARRYVAMSPDGRLVRRTRVSTADVVGEWEEVR